MHNHNRHVEKQITPHVGIDRDLVTYRRDVTRPLPEETAQIMGNRPKRPDGNFERRDGIFSKRTEFISPVKRRTCDILPNA